MSLRSQTIQPDVFEPMAPKKDCRLKIVGAEMAPSWKHKVEGKSEYKEPGKTRVMKLNLHITDEDAVTENKDAKLRRKFEDLVILERHPYRDKMTGETKYMALNKLFQLQEALGFEPKYVDDDGNEVEPKISASGRKYPPKGAHIAFRDEFLDAYFDENDEPKFSSWLDLDVTASVGYKNQSEEDTENFGRRNEVKAYKPKT